MAPRRMRYQIYMKSYSNIQYIFPPKLFHTATTVTPDTGFSFFSGFELLISHSLSSELFNFNQGAHVGVFRVTRLTAHEYFTLLVA